MNNSKFDYQQLKELDERYEPKSSGGCLAMFAYAILMSLVNYVVITTIGRVQRLEAVAGVELTGRQVLGLDPDPIAEKLEKERKK